MTQPKVLISDKLSPKAKDIFEARGVIVDVKTGLSPEELSMIIDDYDGIAIRSATKITPAILNKAKKLKVVGRAGIGVDNVDISSATQKGVIVMNTPFGNSITTAEHAIAMMFALARQIPQATESTKAGKWEKSKFMGAELTHKTLGIIGCGNIGAIVASRAMGLKMKVIAADPFLSDDRARELGIEKVTLDDLYGRADFITIHTPLNDKTRGLVDGDAFAKMKKNMRIINCARGGIIKESDLLVALENGTVAGAALDVFEVEPAHENPLFDREDVICTPHLGAATSEAQENVAVQVAEQMADYLLNGAVTNALNTPSLTAEQAIQLKPYLSLSKQLGSLVGQISDDVLSDIKVTYEGHVAGVNFKPLTSLIVTEILKNSLTTVNNVNAPIIAKERGIKITESTSDDLRDYQTRITIKLVSSDQERSISGTLLGRHQPRLLTLDDVTIEAEITRDMLYIHNDDKAGFIGALGTTLGKHGVNIAHFNLGRKGDTAIALVSLDHQLPIDAMKDVMAIEHIIDAKTLLIAG